MFDFEPKLTNQFQLSVLIFQCSILIHSKKLHPQVMKHLILFTSIAGVLLCASCETKIEKTEEAKFLVTSPIEKDTTIYKDYVCQIRAISHIELRSQERGYLQNIYVDEGQIIRKGQLMFKIMPMLYEAEYGKAEAEANYAEIEYQNTKSLADSNIVSTKELALSKARLNRAKAELNMAKTHLGFTEIRAPFNGIMGRFNVRLGSLVDEGELLTTLSDNSKMWAYYNVPEAEYLDIVAKKKSDSLLKVKLLMANNVVFNTQGVVETIEADFNNETGNIAFRATFQNPKAILRHGETGSILMPIKLKNALIIPQKATFEILDKKYVFVIDQNNTVQTRLINVSSEMQHLYVISSGLKTSDKVLIEGLRKVKNGQKIQYEAEPLERLLAELNDLHAE